MNYILLLLPVLTYASIKVTIIVSSSKENAKVLVTGRNINVISDIERKTFQLSDEQIKSAILKCTGRVPDDVYLKDPTPWSDIYAIYDWPPVKRILYPTKSTIIGMHTQPIKLITKKFKNEDMIERRFKPKISQHAEETIKHSWIKGENFYAVQEISYTIDFAKTGIEGTTSLSYNSQWGKESIQSQSIGVASSIDFEIILPPGKESVTTLTAMSGIMEIQIDYVATVQGFVAGYYREKYKNSYFWKHNIVDLLSALNLPLEIVSRELIKINFYSDVNIVVRDESSKSSLPCKTNN